MVKPRITVFSGPHSTIANSPPLVTSNKARLKGERIIPGRYDHLVPQILFEPVRVRIKKFTAHPLEEDSSDVYHDDGKPYYEVELMPEDGPYLLPYMARRADGTKSGVPFEAADLHDPAIRYGGRQGFYPDASRIFTEIDRTISGRDDDGEGSILDRRADYDFIRVLPPGGYTKKGEVLGVDYFPYKPDKLNKACRVGDLARAANVVQKTLDLGKYDGGIWLEGSPQVEETTYWLNLLIDTDLPIIGNASQRLHGQLANDGDRNIVDSVDYIVSGKGRGLGAVGIQDQQIFAAREFKKADDRPGNYKATGGHGGILGQVKYSTVTIWYKPNYKHTSTSDVNIHRLPERLEFQNRAGEGGEVSIRVKNTDGSLRSEVIPRVHIVKHAHYLQEDETGNPDHEVDIMARIEKASAEQGDPDEGSPKLHGFVLEGMSPYAEGTRGVMKALEIAAMSGLPVARVGRSDPGGRVMTDEADLFIEGSNLDANKARLLLIASMLKLGRLPKVRDPRDPTTLEREAVVEKIREFQEIFETH
ncbi:MAG TPA: asparaginase domain-containing protein [Candidatus Bathyarchaeia archaeon]|nr:asparaginase domain-containing protein [Candidatus Bathyarchaeia archaeon]